MQREIYESIFKHFRFVSKRDICPLGSKRGNRKKLAAIYNDMGFTRGAEIGVRAGDYSLSICEQMPNIEYYCIDPWHKHNSVSEERQDIFLALAKERLKPFNVTFIKKLSMDALADFEPRSLDFVYIDGDHTFDYVMSDIIFWSQKVKRGGIVACHDYSNCYMGGVIKAVDAYTYCHKIDPWFVIGETPIKNEMVAPSAFWVNP